MDNSIITRQIIKIAQSDLGETEEQIKNIIDDYEKKVREDQAEHDYNYIEKEHGTPDKKTSSKILSEIENGNDSEKL